MPDSRKFKMKLRVIWKPSSGHYKDAGMGDKYQLYYVPNVGLVYTCSVEGEVL